MIKLVVVVQMIHVLIVVQLAGECGRMLIVALLLLLLEVIVEVLFVVLLICREYEIRVAGPTEGARDRLFLVDYLFAVRVSDTILTGGPGNRIKVIESVVDVVVAGLFVVAAAGNRRCLCEFANKSVGLEVASDVGGCGVGGGRGVIVANILVIRLIFLLVVVRQVSGARLSSHFEQRATRLIERMISCGGHRVLLAGTWVHNMNWLSVCQATLDSQNLSLSGLSGSGQFLG